MSRKSLGYTELEWTCPYCDGRNPGTVKICGNCGSPQPDDVEFQQPAQEELITDEEQVAAIEERGADIHCGFCGTRNPGDAATCSQCGADLTEGEQRESGEVIGAHKHDDAADIKCPACSTMNPGTARKCSQCGQNLAAPVTPRPKPVAKAPKKKGGIPIVAIVLIAVFGCAAIFLFMTLFRSEEVVGTVQSAEWERAIVIEGLQNASYQNWYDEIPNNATGVGQCQERVHHTQPNPPSGSNYREVCGTPYTVDTGSGFGEVVQDCNYEVYADYCEYTMLEWSPLNTLVVSGSDFNPYWPEVDLLNEEQREGSRNEEFTVVFSADGKNVRYSPNSIESYTQFQPGSEWVLELNGFGGIVGLEQQ
jgi:ribosomal protein L40E